MSSTPGSSTENKGSESWWQRNSRRVWLTVRTGLLLGLIAWAIWSFKFSPIEVTSHSVVTGPVTSEVMGTGTLEARTSAILGPKIGGLVASMAADQGDRVKAGDLLFTLEDSDVKQQVGIAESEVAAATATLERLGAVKRGAEAVLTQAQKNHERIDALTTSKVVSRQELDEAFEALSVAQAELSVAEAGIIEGQRRLDAANRSHEYQRARLHDTTIEAPFDGLIIRRDRDSGDVVAAAASVFQIVSTDEMWISAWVDETELTRLQEGQTARVVFRAEPEVEYPGVLVRVGREVDRETREILVDVRVKRLPATWAVGQRAEVYIQTGHEEDLTVLDQKLVLVRNGQVGVMVNDAGRVAWREIELGRVGRGVVEVTSGLSADDVVVTPTDAGKGALREGRKIKTR